MSDIKSVILLISPDHKITCSHSCKQKKTVFPPNAVRISLNEINKRKPSHLYIWYLVYQGCNSVPISAPVH